MTARLTPSQTVGPFFGPALIRRGMERIAREGARGERIVVEGRILDGARNPVPDAMIEIWQANAEGRYDHPGDTQEARLDPNFHGFGRAGTNQNGEFRFYTIKPGRVAGGGGALGAPHLNLCIFARGLLTHLNTRLYFPEEQAANAADPVLNAVDPARRATLLARDIGTAHERILRFDIVLQGDAETVFFEV